MKAGKKPTATRNNQKKGSKTFWLLAICHYLLGIAALLAVALMAAPLDHVSRKMASGIAIICTVAFAITQPDIRYRRINTGWRYLDKHFSENDSLQA